MPAAAQDLSISPDGSTDPTITFDPPSYLPDHEGEGTVDPGTGRPGGARHLLSIGDESDSGLAYARDFSDPTGARDNFLGVVEANTTHVVVTALGVPYRFEKLSGGGYLALGRTSASLSLSSGVWLLTDRHGTEYRFSTAYASDAPVYAPGGRLTEVRFPDGRVWTLHYVERVLCPSGASGSGCSGSQRFARLMSVTANTGYQIKYQYAATPSDYTSDNGNFTRITKVTAINNTVDHCAASTNGCSTLTKTWPDVDFGLSVSGMTRTLTATDALGKTTRYTYTDGRLTGIRYPSSGGGSDDVGFVYGTDGRVSRVDRAGSSWDYAYSEASGVRTTTVTDPHNKLWVYETDISNQRRLSETDPLGHRTAYAYNADDLLTSVTFPEGNKVVYAYDARGNTTSVARHPKSGSSLGIVTTTLGYASSCTATNRFWCNKPTAVTGWQGTTNYHYANSHGGVYRIELPDAGAGRHTTYLTYQQRTAGYKNTGGQAVTASIWKLIRTSETGGATTDIAYQGGTLTNLEPASITVSGTGIATAVTHFAYDDIGNVTSVNGPLSGGVDQTRITYDALRRPTVAIGVDPDGSGPLRHRASKTTYDPDGRVLTEANGYATGATAFSSFVALETQENAYDVHGRLSRQRRLAGSTVFAVTDHYYDQKSRLLCSAQRMHGLTGSAPGCSADWGPDGHHRVTHRTYDSADRLVLVRRGYDGPNPITERYGYTANGQVLFVEDGRDHRTTYEYDGHDRLTKIRYPQQGSDNASSTTLYESFAWDPNKDLVLSKRHRDGRVTSFGYDALGRVTSVDAPGTTADRTTVYDIAGRPLQLSGNGRTLSYVYDLLGRMTSETGPLGTVSYAYDVAGRRTRMDYPGVGSFYLTYAYDGGGQLREIREKGATSGVGVLARYSYDQLGRKTVLRRGNGVETRYGFDGASRLSYLDFRLPSDTGYNQDVDFLYNPASQIKQRASTNELFEPSINAETVLSAFDDLNQLTSFAGKTAVTGTNGVLADDGVNDYFYDALNRLTSTNVGPSVSVVLSYDPQGRLFEEKVIETSGISTLQLLYDGASLIAEHRTDGTVARRYVHGSGVDEPLVWYEGSGTADRRFLVADERGSIVLVTNASGQTLGVNRYDENGLPDMQNIGRFGYTGQIRITKTELWHYKARAYAPRLGRFLQPDPIGYADGFNLFAYVGGDPVNKSDPTGLCEYETVESSQDSVTFRVVEGSCSSGGSFGNPGVAMMGMGRAAARSGFAGIGAAFGGGLGVFQSEDQSSNSEEDCPDVPISPPGVDINDNIELAQDNRLMGVAPNPQWFLTMVPNKQPWDYKQKGSQYEDFGNFNYGAAGRANGFSERRLLREAGRAQQAAETSRPSWGNPGPVWMPGAGDAPFGDDPADQAQIKLGAKYYDNGCYKN